MFFLRPILRLFPSYRELEYYAYHDELTGALRRWQIIKISKAWTRTKKEFAVIYIDFDDFKSVNDAHGHAAGDALLVHFVRVAKKYLGKRNSHIGRMGGDEFLIVLEKDRYSHPEGLSGGLQTICIDSPLKIEGLPEIPLSVSTGWAWVTADIDKAIQTADRDVYFAKGNTQKRRVRYRGKGAK